ncbi:MAG: glutamate synthase large subunit [Oscillospiraceae bacterium]|nr:glutamate synthase large subunit [Oscillospiraceae bacterium]
MNDHQSQGLYDPAFEHDNCGIGAVINVNGRKTAANVDSALRIVETLEHRAGKDADGKTGDGVGILMQISHSYFSSLYDLPAEREYGIAMLFMPRSGYEGSEKIFEEILRKEGLELLFWRKVPVRPEILGDRARESCPVIMQAFIQKPVDCDKGIEFDRRLYIARRLFEKADKDTYVCSMSSRTIVYKGMFLVGELRRFYDDLNCGGYDSAISIVHSRFSTNTEPSWQRSHPNRLMVHNGEINTIKGNVDKMFARESILHSDHLEERFPDIFPFIDKNGSDSARLDNTLEFMQMCGVPLPLAVTMCLPEPWQHDDNMSREKRAFYQYYAAQMEPWDGPASIIFTDGDICGAVLDRNGLRPSRYYITDNDELILSSEVGALDVDESTIITKERLHPGKMLLCDTISGRIVYDDEIKNGFAHGKPYGEWIDKHLFRLRELKSPNKMTVKYESDELLRLQKYFGYTYEQLSSVIIPMAENGSEPIGSMGTDKPIAVLSHMDPPLFSYFKQMFAQVTNPPIDSIREKVVTSSSVYLGHKGNILKEDENNCRVLKIHSPVLTNADMLKIRHTASDWFRTADISMLYTPGMTLEQAINGLYEQADKAHEENAAILILTDRGTDSEHLAIPSLLAVSALHSYLVRTRMNTAMSIIVESAEPCEVHHFAALLGFGAGAVNPYLALDTIRGLIAKGQIEKDYTSAVNDYINAAVSGIVKIAAKMGISTIQSYQGSGIFEALGVSKEVTEKYFPGTVSRIGGLTLSDIESRSRRLHKKAFAPNANIIQSSLPDTGDHRRRAGGEDHLYDPRAIHLLQQSAWRGDYSLFKEYSSVIDSDDRHITIRSCMEFDYKGNEIPLDEVESAESIMHRFKTGAMSYGSISKEAHECLAIAMNRIGGRSNSGEGGEDDERIQSKGTDNDRCSAIKQVASGRFGVTSEYLCSAKEIQIKMAQGAKPGEGGHLPGGKVHPWIAKTRRSTPGVALISPPPHHDIYSIEDLAQLIYDLKNANKDARISVKLVSEAGVGTIAAGVAKAGAGLVLISGHDGGTGAAPYSSIHNAGLPWELGLAEAHQVLVKNGLRDRIAIETDGKLMTGRDVVIAACLGAEEFGFATAPLVTMGCVMMRVCNLDTCPVGVATQNPELRKRFRGKPEYVINFMRFIAEEMREYMAKLGIRTVNELVGRTDLLKKKEGSMIDLSGILDRPVYAVHHENGASFDFGLESTIDERVLIPAVKNGQRDMTVNVTNLDRTFGTLLGSYITRNSKDTDVVIHAKGSGGQSFGAFIPHGLTISLEGDSNDYFGKGLSGGTLAVFPPKGSRLVPHKNIIIGNVALFGATSGKAFINGIAGERFCVRNSGADVVCEGTGDHGCEYMTGGTAVILGNVGKNFAAGMSGGTAYVLDTENDLYTKLNRSLVGYYHIEDAEDRQKLRSLTEEHLRVTGSPLAKEILEHFNEYLPRFKKVIPHDYKKITELTKKYENEGADNSTAQVMAFDEFKEMAV